MMNVLGNAASFNRWGDGRVRAGAALVTLCVCTQPAIAQCPVDWLPGEGQPGVTGDGPVSALTMWDPDGAGPQSEVLVAAGGFDGAGDVAARRIAMWDGSEWHALGPGDPPGITGGVFALAVYNGDLIVGGNIIAAGGVPVNMIARFDGKGWHPLGSGVSPYPVWALEVYNGELYAGGLFTQAGGVPVNGIARWNGSTWQSLAPPGGGLSAGAGVTALTVFEGKLIVGGAFTSAGGVPATRFASWDGTSWQSMDGGPIVASAADTLAVYNAQLIAGANFFTAGGAFLRSVSRWNGTTWVGLAPGNPTPNDIVAALQEFQGDLYAGGVFTSAGGVSTPNRLARWDGSAWFAIPSGPGTPGRAVGAFAAFNGDLIAGGLSSQASGLQKSQIGRWDGSSWHNLGGGVTNVIIAVASFQGDVYVGGLLTQAGDIAVSRIARRSADGAWDSMQGGVSGDCCGSGTFVSSMAVHDDALIVSGSFTAAGGVPVNGIARWDGESWSAFGSAFAGNLFAHEGELYGTIVTAIPGASQVGQWDPFTQQWQPLGALPPGVFITCFTVFNGELIAAGLGGIAAPAAVFRWDGAMWHPMGGTFGFNAIEALAVYNGELLAGGLFDGFSGGPPGGIMRWSGSTWETLGGGVFEQDSEFFTFGVSDLLVLDGDLFVAGQFSHVGQPFGVPGHNIARWNGSSWATLGDGTNNQVLDIVEHKNGLLLGGWFTLAGGSPNGHFAQWGPICTAGDLDQDGDVDGFDLGLLLGDWSVPAGSPGCDGAMPCEADLNGDGVVNGFDLALLLGNWS